MHKLAKPPQRVVDRVLAELSFKERLVGTQMTQMGGTTQYSLYSFQEAVNFLHFDSLEDLAMPGSKGSIGYIDLQALKYWVANVIEDEGLAAALDTAIENGTNYRDQAMAVKSLMETRLSQCKGATEGEKSRG